MDSEIFHTLIGVSCIVVVIGIVYIIWKMEIKKWNQLKDMFGMNRINMPTNFNGGGHGIYL